MAKNTEKKGTTNINEAARKELSITRDDYALCQYLHYRQGYPNDKNPGWCVDDKNEISDFIGISRPGLYKMIDRLERLKLIETDAVTGHCRATKLFINTEAQCKQSSRDGKSKRVNKVNTERKQSLQTSVNKVTDKELMYSKNISKSKLDISANAAEPEKENSNITLKAKKEKTDTPGPRRAAPKEAPLSHWQETITCFEDVHRQHFTAAGIWIGFDWSGKELKGLKELRGKIGKDIQAKNGYEPDGPQTNAALSRFFTEALKDDFTKNNWFTPSMLNARYQEIKQKIYAHANGTTAAKQRNATVQQQQHDLLATVIANRRY